MIRENLMKVTRKVIQTSISLISTSLMDQDQRKVAKINTYPTKTVIETST